MAGSRAAVRYAKAVLSLATDQKSVDAVNNDMKVIVNSITENKDLHDMLQNPIVRSSVKKAVLSKVFTKTNTLTDNLINTLFANKRIALLGDVASKYNQ